MVTLDKDYHAAFVLKNIARKKGNVDSLVFYILNDRRKYTS